MGEVDKNLDEMTSSLQVPKETIVIKDENGVAIGNVDAFTIIGDEGFHIVGFKTENANAQAGDIGFFYEQLKRSNPRLVNWPEAEFSKVVLVRNPQEGSVFIIKTRQSHGEPSAQSPKVVPISVDKTLGPDEQMRQMMRGLFSGVRDVHTAGLAIAAKGNLIAPTQDGVQFQLQVL